MTVDLTYAIEITLYDFLSLFPDHTWHQYGEEYALLNGDDLISVEFRMTKPGSRPPLPPLSAEKQKQLEEVIDQHIADLTNSDPKRVSGGM